ncbi:MAG: hypothetical protein KDN05_09110 [Verrucomicrobiae bacterium]|nr:hypothetical protein [Verrucomicrobiae bacterium]
MVPGGAGCPCFCPRRWNCWGEETISWNGRCRVLAVYKTFGPERAAKGIDAMKSVCAK